MQIQAISNTHPKTTLAQCLQNFSESVNKHPRMAHLLAGWEPVIVIQTTDTGSCFSLLVREAKIEDIRTDIPQAHHKIHLQAEDEVLKRIFTGYLNPAKAYMDGLLEVLGSDRDQVKLDAISLVLWGV